MGTLLLYGLIAMIAVGVLFGLAVLLLPSGEQIAPPAPDIKQWVLADRPLQAQDVTDVRLPVALRGYRFAETDLLLDRLTEELRVRDEEIARLRSPVATDPRAPSSGDPASPDTPPYQPSPDQPQPQPQPSYELPTPRPPAARDQ